MQQHPHHDQAAEYRRQAQEIRTMVQKLSIDEAREQLLETAERLEGLAQEEECRAHAGCSKLKPQSEA
jgi:GTP cyclohydrolase I